VTSTLVFEGDGRIGDYVGGYADWIHEKEKRAVVAARKVAGQVADLARSAPRPAAGASTGLTAPPERRRKLTNKEQRELETLPKRIETLEVEQAELTAKLADPAFYRNEARQFAEVKARLDALEREHAAAFARWEELEAARNDG
jgi:ATP-binding cassette subfamily F protein uup